MRSIFEFIKSKIKYLYKAVLFFNKLVEQLLLLLLILYGLKNYKIVELPIRSVICMVIFILLIDIGSKAFYNKYIKNHMLSFRKINIKNSILVVIVMCNLVNVNLFITLISLYIINACINMIFNKLYENELILDSDKLMVDIEVSKKRYSLIHELGHYFFCKERRILEPIMIDLVPLKRSNARIITNGDMEEVFPFTLLQMLISGHIAAENLCNDKTEFTPEEIKYVLLGEFVSMNFSDDYSSEVVKIYLDNDKLSYMIELVIDIINKYKDDILLIADENINRSQIYASELEKYFGARI